MASRPLTRRHTALDETLRTLDDAFMAALTPTNTWLDNVQPSSEDGEDDVDHDTSTKEDYSVHFRHNRYQTLPKSKHSKGQSDKKTSSLEPRSASLPPGTRTKAAYPLAAETHDPPTKEETSNAVKVHSETEFLLEIDTFPRRANTDPQFCSGTSSPVASVVLEPQCNSPPSNSPLEKFLHMYSSGAEATGLTSPSCT